MAVAEPRAASLFHACMKNSHVFIFSFLSLNMVSKGGGAWHLDQGQGSVDGGLQQKGGT